MPSISISTWSLHRQLGKAWYVPVVDGLENRSDIAERIELLDVPKLLSEQGISQLEVCHFHFPSVEPDYLDSFCEELSRHNITFYSLLIDTGDITHPDVEQRTAELDLIKSWIDVAGKCGAKQARVVAGEAEPSAEAIKLSAQNLNLLAEYADQREVQITTENFKKLTQHAEPLLEILDRCDAQLGLCTDFGNFKGEAKYDELSAILPQATTIHAKGDYVDGELVQEDFSRCMNLAKSANFDGPYVLIFSDKGEEWPYLQALKKEVETYL